MSRYLPQGLVTPAILTQCDARYNTFLRAYLGWPTETLGLKFCHIFYHTLMCKNYASMTKGKKKYSEIVGLLFWAQSISYICLKDE